MKNFTHLRSFICFFILFFFSLSDAKAQLPEIESAACFYDEPHLFLSYETIIDDDAEPENLTVVLNVFVPEGNPGGIDDIIFSAAGLRALAVSYSAEELAANPFVELTVNRDLFLAAPDVFVTATQDLFGPISRPLYIIDFQARLDSDEPCLEITPLPVELITFEGAATDNGVELSWSTASEQNNSHFEVQRSADGEVFEQVGSVAGHGNSSTRINYNHTDFTSLPGQSYYRLKQVDYDGQYEYSKIIAVTATDKATDQLQVTLAPNPCPNGDCQISIQNASGAQETHLELADLSGRVLYTTTVQHTDNGTITLPLQELPAYKGLYILSAISGENVVRQRVVLE